MDGGGGGMVVNFLNNCAFFIQASFITDIFSRLAAEPASILTVYHTRKKTSRENRQKPQKKRKRHGYGCADFMTAKRRKGG
jgi:hypothetical protein